MSSKILAEVIGVDELKSAGLIHAHIQHSRLPHWHWHLIVNEIKAAASKVVTLPFHGDNYTLTTLLNIFSNIKKL